MTNTTDLKASPWCKRRLRVLVTAVTVAVLAAVPFAGSAFGGPVGPPGHDHIWGYNASGAAVISEYAISPVGGTGSVTFAVSCLPVRTGNGRGIAHDPAAGAVPATGAPSPADPGGELLWYTRLVFGFAGDGYIHRATFPSSIPPCADKGAIRFGGGPGGADQDDIGALDLHPVNTQQLAVAGYQPRNANGNAPGNFSIFYKVNKALGTIVGTCKMPFRGGGVGNETLTVANLPGLGLVWLSDAGEPVTTPNSLAAFTDASVNGPAPPGAIPDCNIVADYPKSVPVGLAAIDYEPIPKPISQPRQDSLVATDLVNFYDLDNPPFYPFFALMGITGPGGAIEDITLEAAACPPEDDDDNGDDGRRDDDGDDDGVDDDDEGFILGLLLGDSDSDDDGIVDGNDDANGNGEDDEDEDDDDECPDDDDDDGDGIDNEDEDDDEDDD